MKLAPARLAPVFVPRIWGARSLAPLFAAPPGADPIGEVWLTGDRCEFTSGPFTGRLLFDTWPSLPSEWTGSRIRDTPRIPLLVKFLFPEDKLSVQVHPNDEYARTREAAAGGAGKTEMWYAIAAREGAEVRIGFESGVTPASFRRAIADGAVEACLRRYAVRAGDAFFVPAGTPHMIGPGMVLCEIQEHSDITYRVFDFNRLQSDGTPRALHIRQALEVIDFGEAGGGQVEPLRIVRGPLVETHFAACRYFAAERWHFAERIAAVTSRESFELLVFLGGQGQIGWAGGSSSYGPAQVWLLPAALGAYQLAPDCPTTLLRTYVPNLQTFAQQLADQRIDEAVWSRLVHP